MVAARAPQGACGKSIAIIVTATEPPACSHAIPHPSAEQLRSKVDVRRAQCVGRLRAGHRLEPDVGHLGQHLDKYVAAQPRRDLLVDLARAVGALSEDVAADVPRLSGEPRGVGEPPASRGGSRARPRGRSPTSPCQSSRFGLCQERSTLAVNASSHRMRAPRLGGGTCPSYPNEPGRKSTPRLSPTLALSRSWTSSSAS